MSVIPQVEPWIGKEELDEVTNVVNSKWVTEGEKTKEFEEKFARLCGVKHAIAVSNCTVGLSIILKALGVENGSEVIVPDFTFIASANAVKLFGATPVFVDVDKRTFNIDPDEVERVVSDRTKAILPVHIYGQSADMDRIIEIAESNDLYVIEDAAQGVGVKFREKHVGSLGNASCFSFYGNKTITTGDGGMITTNDKEIADNCYRLKNHGRTKKGVFIHEHIGYNFSYTDLQAAIGLAQLSKLDKIIRRKAEIRKLYKELLGDVSEIEFPYIDPRGAPVYWFTNILVNDPQGLGEHLAKFEIGTRRFFYPLHKQPCYNIKGRFPNSCNAYERGLSLPSSSSLSEEEIIFVCEKIKLFMEK